MEETRWEDQNFSEDVAPQEEEEEEEEVKRNYDLVTNGQLSVYHMTCFEELQLDWAAWRWCLYTSKGVGVVINMWFGKRSVVHKCWVINGDHALLLAVSDSNF
jgi:hypothetical protein